MIILYAVLSYLFGSIPTGYIIFRIIEKKDIRSYGSQAIGATNVLRLKGWRIALPVAIFDIAKGYIPVALAFKLFPDKRIALLGGFLAILGHCFPIFIKFKGGKGVATALGAYLAIAPVSALLSVTVFLIIVLLTRFVSLGSMLAMAAYPGLLFLLNGGKSMVVMSLVVLVLILFKHRENMRRLIRGNERKLGEKAT
ncbi:glycerol-3-phosphate 1-O-acyltransferase PlsY [Acidobacteriota bacterium]